ncbi:MAG: hypothetical protein AB7I57_15140, partial [Pirellulales bacterium]
VIESRNLTSGAKGVKLKAVWAGAVSGARRRFLRVCLIALSDIQLTCSRSRLSAISFTAGIGG